MVDCWLVLVSYSGAKQCFMNRGYCHLDIRFNITGERNEMKIAVVDGGKKVFFCHDWVIIIFRNFLYLPHGVSSLADVIYGWPLIPLTKNQNKLRKNSTKIDFVDLMKDSYRADLLYENVLTLLLPTSFIVRNRLDY